MRREIRNYKKILLVPALLALASCATLGVKPSAPVPKSLLGQTAPEGTSTEQMKDELTRSAKISGWFSGAVVRATLLTPAYLKQKSTESIQNEGFKLKLSEAEIQKKIKAEIDAIEKENKTCLMFDITSSMYEAKDSSAWHGTLEQGAKKGDLKFSSFAGFSRTTTTYTTNRYGKNAYTTASDSVTDYLFSQACTDIKLDDQQDITLVVEPRFKKGIEPLTMKWLVADRSTASCSNAIDVPMKFRGFDIYCLEECTSKIHPLNKSSCEKSFNRYIR